MKRHLQILVAFAFIALASTISIDALSRVILYERSVVVYTGDDNSGLLHIEKLSASLDQGSGSVQILSIKNNMPESTMITVTAATQDFVEDLEVVPNFLSPDEGCVIYLSYDTSETALGEYPLGLVIEADGETSRLVLYREVKVKVTNVAPVVDAGEDQTVKVGEVVSFIGSFTDPGMLDMHTIEWDFGDGSTAAGTLTPTYTYQIIGKYTVTLNVMDNHGGVGMDTVVITVEE